MTVPANSTTPKKFLLPLAGGTKNTTIYLGDPYSTFLAAPATIGATVISLDDTSEFLPAGTAVFGSVTITYTGISGSTLTGVSGVTAAITAGTVGYPAKTWFAGSQTVLYSAGADKNVLGIAMRLHGATSFDYPGMPLILSASPIVVYGSPIAIDLQVFCPPGALEQFADWQIVTGSFYPRAAGDTTVPTVSEIGITAVLAGYVLRRDQQLGQMIRVVSLARQIQPSLPAFAWGSYRWRDSTEINAHALIPSNWDIDPTVIGTEKFIAGIGSSGDLKPVAIVQQEDSVYLQVERGYYYTGINSYYLPAKPQLDIVSGLLTTLLLSKTPASTLPIFVGTYKLDSQGYYEKDTVYRYQTAAAIAAAALNDTALPALWYTLDRSVNTITLNAPMETKDLFIGVISGQAVDYFSIPTYPVDQVTQVYVLASAGSAAVVASNWVYDQALGTITITAPSGSGVSVPGTSPGMTVFATCSPALVILYETENTPTLTIDSADLNPAFSGTSGGFVYLEQSRQQAASLSLACDKPLILIPATYSSIIGLVAYGPVYFNGDYALLQATAFSAVPNETVSGVRLKVVVNSSNFTGLINYVDPLVTPIEVVTGADGIANLIFTANPNFGLYIPVIPPSGSLAGVTTTTVANDTIVLPELIPISQLYNASDGWLVTLYTVLNNSPFYGMVGADVGAGQIPFATTGTPGTVGYRTNGSLQPYLTSTNLLLPIVALDSAGNNYASTSFNGNIAKLVFAQTLPTASPVAALFLAFLQRTVIQVQEVNSDVVSNSILLEIILSPLIDDSVWLTLNDSAHGILNQYRLGVSAG